MSTAGLAKPWTMHYRPDFFFVWGGGGEGTWHLFLTDIMFFALDSSSVELHSNKQSIPSSSFTGGGVTSWLVRSP